MTGYGCEDAFHSHHTLDMAWKSLETLLPDTQGIVVTVGLPVLFQNGVFNCACVIADGQILGLVAKRYLAGDGIHYEPRWFKPWSEGTVRTIEQGQSAYPIGDLCFEVGGVRFGFEICEDAWVANRPGAALSMRGVDVILNPSASHFAFGKLDLRKRFVLEGSRAFGVSYIYANLMGNESGRAIYDGGAMIATGGKLIAVGKRLSFHDYYVISAVVDVEAMRMSQARTASFRPALDDRGQDIIRRTCNFAPATLTARVPVESADVWELSANLKAEEFVRAEVLALFDYMRKSRSNGFLISLSGGADSAACAVLVSLMVLFGVQELGLEAFKQKLAHIPGVATAGSVDALREVLLITVYQPSENSGQVTRCAAETVANALHAKHYVFDVTQLVKGYVEMVETAVKTGFSWKENDIALQNIQARVRSPGAWLLANIRGALFLSTSNRSEAAVGYATMDGDTSGGLSPLAGIDKAWLREWLCWMENTGPAGIGALPELSVINGQQPTAELRPQDQVQTDEDDLMPYPLLDAIERAAIRDKQPPRAVLDLMRVAFPQYAIPQLHVWVERFFKLWSRNQWKRERYAPSFHLDDETKTWCRWPILSGGFAMELEELKAHVAKICAQEF
ncbi:MAG: NAD(+) synthase [Chthoniobacteraceae bacterium]